MKTLENAIKTLEDAMKTMVKMPWTQWLKMLKFTLW